MIYVPAEISLEETGSITGVILEQKELEAIIGLIERQTQDGLKGDDAALLLTLKDASEKLHLAIRNKQRGMEA